MNVFAVVVAYHPSVTELVRLCRTLVASGADVVVVDNSEAGGVDAALLPGNCVLISLGDNTGIAHAQNVGIAAALGRGAEAIVLFDQDSDPAEDLLGKLLGALSPGQPGVAAPVGLDRTSGQEMPSFRLSNLGLPRKVLSRGRLEPYEVDLVIASGCLATAATFSVAGTLDEDFFIDFVDFEWCMRCRTRNIPVRVVPDAIMKHSIGRGQVDLGPFRTAVHGAARSYYKVRNTFLLFRKPHVPVLYAIRATVAALIQSALMLLFVDGRRTYVKTLLLGIRHGLSGVVGKNPVVA